MQKAENPCEKIYTHRSKDGWTILGPGGGGRTLTPTVSPHDSDIVLVSCDMTAGYITHNSGQSWREFNLRSRIYSYCFDPLDPYVIYAGSTGLFRSSDRGESWKLIFPSPESVNGEIRTEDNGVHNFESEDNWPGGEIEAINVDEKNSSNICICVRCKNKLKVLRSTDKGASWDELCSVPGDYIHKLFFHNTGDIKAIYIFTEKGMFVYGNSGLDKVKLPSEVLGIAHADYGLDCNTGILVLYMTVWSEIDNNYLCSIIKSEDLGETWQQQKDVSTPQLQGTAELSLICVCRNKPDTAYVIVEKFPEKGNDGNLTDKYGVLKTNDGGINWDWVVKMDDMCDAQNRTAGWPERNYGASWGDLKGEDQISPKGRYAWGIGVSPVYPDICYTTDFSTIFRTCDGGCTWEHVSTRDLKDGSFTSTGVDVISSSGMFFDPFDSKHIAAVFFDCGIFHSYNKGESWLHAIEGVPRKWINSCYWIVFDPDIRGKTWSAWSTVHNIPRVRALNIESHMKNLRGGICRAENGIDKWMVSSRGIPEKSIPVHIIIDPESPPGNRTLYTAVFYRGIYKSEDDGRTWTLRNNGIGDNRNVWRLATVPGGAIYLLISRGVAEGQWIDGSLYKSTDGGNSWVDTGLPEDMGSPSDLVFDPECPSRMYLACWPGTHGAERKGGLFVTEDSGKTWNNVFNAEVRVFAVALLPNRPSTVFITTFESGVYKSDDRGESWQQLKGFDFQWCHRPLPDPDNNDMIYLTTHGSAIWYGPVGGSI